MEPRHLCAFCAIVLMIAMPIGQASAQEDEGIDYEPVSTKDPKIPKDQLAILVTPLTLEELEVEAGAWMDLVKVKSREISTAEIAVKFKNEKIEAAKQAESSEAVEPEEDEIPEDNQELQQAVEKAEQEAVQAAEEQEAAEQQAAAEQGEAVEEEPEAAPQTAAEQEAEVKTALLDNLTELREQRTALIDRTRVVLDEMDKKGSEGETETQRRYLKAVSGIRVQADDLQSTWATVRGWLTSKEGGQRWAWNIGTFLVILTAFFFLARIVGGISNRALRRSQFMSKLMRDFLAKSIRRVILAIGVIVALAALEVNITPLLALIGGAAFIIGFALQDTLSNFASGIMILVYRPFDVGDVVDAGGVSGKVNALNLVSVTIHTFDNQVVIVPNNTIWNNVIRNATGNPTRRVDLVFGIGYGDDAAKAQRILEQTVAQHPLTLDNPEPTIKLNELGDSSVNFICRPWTKTADYWTVYWDLMRQVKERFDQEGISIPFPQRDIHVYQEATANDRAREDREALAK